MFSGAQNLQIKFCHLILLLKVYYSILTLLLHIYTITRFGCDIVKVRQKLQPTKHILYYKIIFEIFFHTVEKASDIFMLPPLPVFPV